jgi:hypothetical protein
MTRSGGIFSIFQKQKGRTIYTKKAQLYQSILKYSITRKNENTISDKPFRHWDLAKWLMDNNSEFINRYKDLSTKTTKYANRIENTRRRTKDKVNHLVDLELMRIAGHEKELKGTDTIPVFKYTKMGHFFALLIESYDPNKRANAVDEIYDLFVNSMFSIKENSSSYAIFYNNFFKKSKENNFFGDIIGMFRQILDSGEVIMTAEMLFRLCFVSPRFQDQEKERLFLSIWALTIRSLDQKTRELVYYHLKLEIERRMEKLVIDGKQFEELQYRYRDRVDTVILECFCENCDLYFYLPICLHEYRYRISTVVTQDFLPTTCVKCGEPSLRIPHLFVYHKFHKQAW